MTENSLVNLSSTEQALEAVLQTFTDPNFILAPDGAILDYRSNNPFTPIFHFQVARLNQKHPGCFPLDVADNLEHARSMVQQTGNIVYFGICAIHIKSRILVRCPADSRFRFTVPADRPGHHRVQGNRKSKWSGRCSSFRFFDPLTWQSLPGWICTCFSPCCLIGYPN